MKSLNRAKDMRIAYLGGLGLAAMATLLSWPLHAHLRPVNLAMLYLASVVISARYLGQGPSVVTSVAGTLAFDFFWVEPVLTFQVRDSEYLLTFVGLIGVGLVIGRLTSQLQEQIEKTVEKQKETALLLSLSSRFNSVIGQQAIAVALADCLRENFGLKAALLVRRGQTDELIAYPEGSKALAAEDLAVAQSVFETGIPAGARMWFIPLKAHETTMGLLSLETVGVGPPVPDDKAGLIDGLAGLTGLTLERSFLADQANELRFLKMKEDLQSALFNSVSHEVRTPMTSIMGVLSSLRESTQEDGIKLDPATEQELVETAWEQAKRLDMIFGDLLNMSRLEAGALRLHIEPADLADVIGSALGELSDVSRGRDIQVHTSGDIPLVPMDYVLIKRALVILIDNALKYSPAGTTIDLSTSVAAGYARIHIEDRGPGIRTEDMYRVFDKFYRVPGSRTTPGLGLGLSIARGLARTHGGDVTLNNREEGGAAAVLFLPLESQHQEG